MRLPRRSFLHLAAGAAALPAASHFSWAQVSPTTAQRVRVATGLLATWQSTAWLGAEAGLFKKRGIEMSLPAIAVGGPEAAAGLIRGDWEFAHTGTVPVAEEVLKGRDIVILATPTSVFPMSFVMTTKEITELAQLGGKKVGVLTETGQTSVAARITVEKAGATATYLPLVTFDRIYAALASGEIDAGALPIDLRFTGQAQLRLECLSDVFLRHAVHIRDHAEADRFQPRACDERHAGLRRDDPFVQDAAGHRRAVAATLLEDRRSKSGGGIVRISRAGISKGSATVVSRNADVAGLSCREIPGRGVAEGIRHC